MGHALGDLVRHNSWATRELLTFCDGLDAEVLHATTPGTFGTIIETFRHYIDSEMSYTYRLTGAWKERPWVADQPVGLDELQDRTDVLARAWDEYLAGEVDVDRLGEATGDNGDVFAVRAGVFIVQIFHHANEHRAQICSVLGANGIEPPELSAWVYGLETGRSWLTAGPSMGS
jgi:uncharacterized damage-inducible protein DinB